MAFTPYTIDTNSTGTSYTVLGLIPGKQYQFTVTPKNAIGSGAASNTLTTTMAAQSATSTPTLVQNARFRDNGTNNGTITLSLPSAPNAANTIFVFMGGHGAGNDSPSVVAPGSATLLGGPFYDTASGQSNSEVQYVWQITGDVSNSYTFSNYNSSDYSSWRIVEAAGVTLATVDHGAATESGTTQISWLTQASTASNCIRLSNISSNNVFASVGGGSTGVAKLQADVSGDLYHGGFLATASINSVINSIAISGGNSQSGDNPTYVNLTLYGNSTPAKVTNLASSNITSAGCKLTWNALSIAPTSYTVQVIGGSYSTLTALGTVPGSTTSFTATNLIASTAYTFSVLASNNVGQGPASDSVNVTTTAVLPLQVVQSAYGTDIAGGSATSTLTATFPANTTVGNTLAFFFTGFASANNLALVAPNGSSNSTGILRDDGSTSDPVSMFWTQSVTTAKMAYSYGPIDDAGSLIVIELQGVTNLDAAVHAGSLTYTDGASGSVTLPLTAPSSGSSLGLYGLHMTNTPDSWGSAPSGLTKLQAIAGNSGGQTYHQGAVFQAAASATGNKVIPYSLGSTANQQVAPPTYIGVNFYGAQVVAAPGTPTLSLGTTTSTSQALSWVAPVGTTTSYTVEYRITGGSTFTAIAGVTATSYTVTGLSQLTNYDYRVTALNNSTPGTPTAIQTKGTLATAPGAVTNLALGTTTANSQALTWNAATPPVTAYVVRYKKATDTTYTEISGLTNLSYTVSGLLPLQSYNYQVYALNTNVPGTVSNTVTASTAAAPTTGNHPVLIGGKPFLIGGKIVLA